MKSIQEILKEMILIYEELQNFIKDEDNTEENFINLNTFLDETKIREDHDQLTLFLRLILNISNNQHREPFFFSKIEKIISIFKDEILKYHSNLEIFHIFKSNKRILLYLVEEKIMIFDKYIINKITNDKYKEADYHRYFSPEIKPFLNEKWFLNKNDENLINQIKEELPSDFYENRKNGVNSDFICKLIQRDLIKEFISYVNKNDYSLTSFIKNSIYETNLFLIKNQNNNKSKKQVANNNFIFPLNTRRNNTNLIEYAAFNGSIQIFKYLLNSEKIKLTPSIWLYAIHGQNAEIIHILEDHKIEPKDKTFKECIFESIKCHHNEIANYLYLNHSENENSDSFDLDNSSEVFNLSLKYYNFGFIQNDFINESSLFYLCKYDYYSFVELILKNKNVDINKSLIKTIEKISNEKTPLYIAVEKENFDIVNLLLTVENIDVNTKYVRNTDSSKSEKGALYCAVENNNFEITKLLLSNDKIDANSCYSYKTKINTLYEIKINTKQTALFTAVSNENIEIINLLLSNDKIDVNEISIIHKLLSNYISKTALNVAVEKENIEILDILLNCEKIDVNIASMELTITSHQSRIVSFKTPIFTAVENENIEIIKHLLANDKININIINYKKEELENITVKKLKKTVLFFALEKNNIEIIQLLLQANNIDVNIINEEKVVSCDYDYYEGNTIAYDEQTVFYFALEKENFELIKFFLSIDKNVINVKNKFKTSKSLETDNFENKLNPIEYI